MVTAIRATVMLAVLVGLPAAWVYYGPLPDRAQRVVDRFVAAAKEAVDWKNGRARAPKPAAPAATAPKFAAATAPLSIGAVTTPAAATPSPMPAPASPTLAERMEPLLAELKKYGVAEYALEPWGAERRLFRFHCEMPIGGSDKVTEQFEAVAADPQTSIAQVVADVTSWRAARGGTAW
jgi:hypothetical protein